MLYVTSDHYSMLIEVLCNDVVNTTEDTLYIADGKIVKNFSWDKLSDVQIKDCHNMLDYGPMCLNDMITYIINPG